MGLSVVAAREPENWERLGARVAELSGLLNAAHAALIDTIAEVIDTESWGGYGYRSPEHWVALHCGVSAARAAQFVAAAGRVNLLPACAALFRAGELSVDQAVTALRRTPVDCDEDVAEVAPTATVGQLRRMVAALPPLPRDDDDDPPRPPEERRDIAGSYDDDGSYVLHGYVPGDVGALFEKTMTAARSDLFDNKVPGIDAVDAFERILHLALDALDPATAKGGGRSSDRYQVVLHVDARAGTMAGMQPHLGEWLPERLAHYLSCDSPNAPRPARLGP